MDYSKHAPNLLKDTPQTEFIRGRESEMTQNNGGGVGFKITPWQQLTRFLVLGSEGGTYYVTEQKLTKDNTKIIEQCLELDYKKTIDIIESISVSARAPKAEQIIFALAVCASSLVTHQASYALSKLNKICRTGTHLFRFLHYIDQFRGWGPALKKAVQNWYYEHPTLALQLTKYKQREGWSHRDALRLSHPKPRTEEQSKLFNYACKGEYSGENSYLEAVLEVEKSDSQSRVISLIQSERLPWEVIPDKWKNDPKIWDALLPSMGATAMIRNLNKMTQVGLLLPGSDATQTVVKTISDPEKLRAAKLHPFNVLLAMMTYRSGKGLKGKLTWSPVSRISDALNDAFYFCIPNIVPTEKRILFALDVSGSMSMCHGTSSLTPRNASAAMAMLSARTEENYQFMAFSSGFMHLDITCRDSLLSAIKTVSNLPFDATDCSLPMTWAMRNRHKYDAFVIYTDSETNCNEIHPSLALQKYRDQSGIDAKLVVVGMTATDISIADPKDDGMLDVVGLDAATPILINDFIRGGF